MNRFVHFLALVAWSALATTGVWATTYYSKATGDFNTAGNWNTQRNGSGTDATAFLTHTFIVQSGHTMTLSATLNITGLTVETGGTVDASTYTLGVSGALTLQSSSTFKQGGTVTSVPGGSGQQTLDVASTYRFNGTQNPSTVDDYPEFGNLVWEPTPSGDGVLGNTNSSSPFYKGLVVRGNLTLNIQGATSRKIQLAGGTTNSRTHTIDGDLNISSSSTVLIVSEGVSGTGTTGTLTIGGDINITSGTFQGLSSTSTNGGTAVVNLSGALNNSGGTIQPGASTVGSYTFNFTGSGNKDANCGTNSFHTVDIASGRTVNLLTNDMSIASGKTLTVNGVLNCGSQIVTGSGGFTLSSGATLGVGSTAGITSSGSSGSIQVGGSRSFSTSANYSYNGSSAQATGNGLPSSVNNLTINTTGGVTLDGSETINGTLTLTKGYISLNGNTISYGGSGALVYNGTGLQTTDNAEFPSSSGPNSLTINNSMGVQLGASRSIPGTLTFTTGCLLLGSYDLTLPGSVSGAAAAKCVVINGTGGVVRSIAASGSFVFPIAHASTVYNPVSIALGSSDPTETFTAIVASSFSDAVPNSATAVARQWTISEGTPGGNNITYTFQWVGTEEGASFSRASAGIWRDITGTWTHEVSGTTSGSDPYILTASTSTSNVGRFLVGNDGALPVQLVSFATSANRFAALLHWSTATETNNYCFEIERRTVGSNNWQKVGFVAGAGTSSSPHEYSYSDADLSPGRYAYRLKQVDKDGTFTYSGAAEVEVGLAAKEFKLSSNYPNPFNPSTTIEFTLAEDGKALLNIFNMLGQEVASLFDGEAQAGRLQQVKFDASRLPSGLYFAKLEAGKQQMIKKMVLLR